MPGRALRADQRAPHTAGQSADQRQDGDGPAPPALGTTGRLLQRVRRLRRALRGAWFDRRLGVETRNRVITSSRSSEHFGYEAADVWQLEKVLPRREVGPDDVLVDVGAGKGRVLLFAVRHYALRRVIGVELMPQLAAVARRNVSARPEPERCRMTIVEADAATWRVPEDATVFHLFNPFGGATFRSFLASVVESQRRRPRLVRLVYSHGRHHRDVLDAGFEVVRVRPRYALYQRHPNQEDPLAEPLRAGQGPDDPQ
ncbi:class I SAM-dependent methyltransferase [Longispora sp. NPDC051575]|uniref:class I SAM-dependent methyltransferase n=1 Tax=Longispora sp. NPDC051575 TaxID=3154943 RepID=UPI00343C529C